MNSLKQRVIDLIGLQGPMPVSDYMAICLFDPSHGYYTTRDPFGRAGDFTTAPEISQMFGELIGAWLIAAWRQIGAPPNPLIVEIGPGRGTLMKDIVRTVSKLAPSLAAHGPLHLVEISDRLAAVQAATLRDRGNFAWHKSIEDLPRGPLLIVGNELFDAIPARQYVKTSNGWRERCVDVGPDGDLRFVAGGGSLDGDLLPPGADAAGNGAIFEVAPARVGLAQQIANRIAGDAGAALFIDYGHLSPGFGDTLQAVLSHQYDNPLAHPGEADLTSHVDFAALAAAVRQAGLTPHLETQGAFLLRQGLLERAGALGANADATTRERLSGEVSRLAGRKEMGELFKVLTFSHSQTG